MVTKNGHFVEAPCSFLKKRARRLGEKHIFQDPETTNGRRTAAPSKKKTHQKRKAPAILIFSTDLKKTGKGKKNVKTQMKIIGNIVIPSER